MPRARNAARKEVLAQVAARRKNQDAAHATREIRENQAEAAVAQLAITMTTTTRHATAEDAGSKFVFYHDYDQ